MNYKNDYELVYMVREENEESALEEIIRKYIDSLEENDGADSLDASKNTGSLNEERVHNLDYLNFLKDFL